MKEFRDTFYGRRGFVVVLLFPLLFVVLVGNLRTQSLPFKLLLVGLPTATLGNCEVREPESIRRTLTLLCEASSLAVKNGPGKVLDPLAKMRDGGFDLLLDLGCEGASCPQVTDWRLYTGITDPSRLTELEAVVANLEGALSDLNKELSPNNGKKVGAKDVGDVLFDTMARFTSVRSRLLFVYHPLAENPSLYLLPMTISLIVCFLPFALAVSSFIREREARTLEILLAAPGVTPAGLMAGKCILPVGVTLANFLIMSVYAQSFYGIDVKEGVASIVLFLVPATLAATFTGLYISLSAGSQSQAMLAGTLYFLALALLSGFLLPLGESSAAVQLASNLLPLTYVLPVIRSWMFGAHSSRGLVIPGLVLISQCLIAGVAASRAFRRTLERI
jgi:ABC-type multidrug transport system permease subunit